MTSHPPVVSGYKCWYEVSITAATNKPEGLRIACSTDPVEMIWGGWDGDGPWGSGNGGGQGGRGEGERDGRMGEMARYVCEGRYQV